MSTLKQAAQPDMANKPACVAYGLGLDVVFDADAELFALYPQVDLIPVESYKPAVIPEPPKPEPIPEPVIPPPVIPDKIIPSPAKDEDRDFSLLYIGIIVFAAIMLYQHFAH